MTDTPRVPHPRCVALVGPQGGGKTSLLESILHVTGASQRKGSIKDGNTVGDSTDEAKTRLMSTEVTPAQTTYLGDSWTFLDCPGSVELAQDSFDALMAADAAVVSAPQPAAAHAAPSPDASPAPQRAPQTGPATAASRRRVPAARRTCPARGACRPAPGPCRPTPGS